MYGAGNPFSAVGSGAIDLTGRTIRGVAGGVTGAIGAGASLASPNNIPGAIGGTLLGGPQALGAVPLGGAMRGLEAGTRTGGRANQFRPNYNLGIQNARVGGVDLGIGNSGLQALGSGALRRLQQRQQQRNNNQTGGGSPGPGGPPPPPGPGGPPSGPNPVIPGPSVPANPFPPMPGPGFVPPMQPFTPFTPFNTIPGAGNPLTRYTPGYDPTRGTYRRQGGYA